MDNATTSPEKLTANELIAFRRELIKLTEKKRYEEWNAHWPNGMFKLEVCRKSDTDSDYPLKLGWQPRRMGYTIVVKRQPPSTSSYKPIKEYTILVSEKGWFPKPRRYWGAKKDPVPTYRQRKSLDDICSLARKLNFPEDMIALFIQKYEEVNTKQKETHA